MKMPSMRIFNYDISYWFVIAIAAIIGGVWYFKRNQKEAKAKEVAEKAAKDKANGVTENKKLRQDITVPGAGVLSVDVETPIY